MSELFFLKVYPCSYETLPSLDHSLPLINPGHSVFNSSVYSLYTNDAPDTYFRDFLNLFLLKPFEENGLTARNSVDKKNILFTVICNCL